MPITKPITAPANPRHIPELAWLTRATRLLDAQFRVPGTSFRFGLDPLLGLLPVAGSVVSFGLSAAMLLTVFRRGGSQKLLLLLLGNLALDATVGSIPVLGNLFDFAYRANERNLRLMHAHFHEGAHQGKGWGLLLAVLAVFLLLLALAGYALWRLVSWLAGWG